MNDNVEPFDIKTIGEFQQIGFTAESTPKVHIDPSEVPSEFHHLIPYAETWGISCDARRGDFQSNQSEEAARKFWYDVQPHREAINRWIDSLPEWTTAGYQFMYMLIAHCETTPAEVSAQLRASKNANK